MKKINSHSRKDQITISLPTDMFAAEYFKIIQNKLEQSYIFHCQTNGNRLSFKGSLFRFIWNGWNVFNPISRGEIEFTEENGKSFIRHKIYFTESILIAFLFHLIPIFTLKFDPWLSLIVFVLIWLVYGINYLVAIFRFNSYISDILMKVNFEHGYSRLIQGSCRIIR